MSTIERLAYSSAGRKPPREIRTELRAHLMEGRTTFAEAMELIGVSDHPSWDEFLADWSRWRADALSELGEYKAAPWTEAMIDRRKSPREISRELRKEWEAGQTFADAIVEVGAQDHPRIEEFRADWEGWTDASLDCIRPALADEGEAE